MSRHRLAWLLGLLAVLQIVFQLLSVTRGTDYIVANLTVDDTYYYLLTAWNHQHLGFATFDGLHDTNGVQLLWYLVVYTLTFIATSRDALLVLALLVCIGMNAAVYAVLWQMLRRMTTPVAHASVVFAAVLWWVFNVRFRILLYGMETSLYALLFWGVLAALVMLNDNLRQNRRAPVVLLTVVVILLTWTRLDGALFAVIASGYALFALYRTGALLAHRRVLLQALALSVAGAVVMLAAYIALGRTPLPVSGMIKLQGYAFDITVVPHLLWRAVGVTGAFLVSIETDSPRRSAVILGSVAVLALALEWLYRRSLSTVAHEPRSTLIAPFAVLGGGALIHTLYLAGLSSGAEYEVWYQAPALVLAMMLWSMLISRWYIGLVRASTPILATGIMLIIFGVSFVIPIPNTQLAISDRLETDHHYTRLQVGRWLSANLPGDTVLAGWNAGELGYFSSQHFINLDGLINSADYYRTVLNGEVSLETYLADNHVQYVVDRRPAIKTHWAVEPEHSWQDGGEEIVLVRPLSHAGSP